MFYILTYVMFFTAKKMSLVSKIHMKYMHGIEGGWSLIKTSPGMG